MCFGQILVGNLQEIGKILFTKEHEFEGVKDFESIKCR